MAEAESTGRYFFMPTSGDVGESLKRAIGEAPVELRGPIQTFDSSIRSILGVLNMPMFLALAHHWSDQTQHVRMTLLLQAKTLVVQKKLKNEEVEGYINEKSAEHLKANTGVEDDLPAGVALADRALDAFGATAAVEDLHRQGAVLLWGAFEVLARDFLTSFINNRPRSALAFAKEDKVRKPLQLRGIDVETLALHGFDLRQAMGTVVVGGRELSDLHSIRECANAIFGAPPKDSALGANGLWLLNQRRHLIVHRAGFVDRHYLERTGDAIGIGERLALAPADLNSHVGDVVVAAKELTERATGVWAQDAAGATT